MKKMIFLIFIIAMAVKVFSISDDEMAVSYYLLAEEEYNKGNYEKTITNLNEAKNLLKSTNPKIQVLLVKTLYDSKKYSDAEKELNLYFSVITENDKKSSNYFEMVKMAAKIKEETDREKKLKEDEAKKWKADVKKIRAKNYPDYKYHSTKDGVNIYYKKIKGGNIINFLLFNTNNNSVKVESNITVYWTDLKNMSKNISSELSPGTGVIEQFSNKTRGKYDDAEIEIVVEKVK